MRGPPAKDQEGLYENNRPNYKGINKEHDEEYPYFQAA